MGLKNENFENKPVVNQANIFEKKEVKRRGCPHLFRRYFQVSKFKRTSPHGSGIFVLSVKKILGGICDVAGY
jgi:hypothetical protein